MDSREQNRGEKTHYQRRRYNHIYGVKAAEIAIERSGVAKEDIDFVVFATLSPDYYFPGPGVLVQRDLGLRTGALDVRNQCSGFVYAISAADQYIKTGMYKNILVILKYIQQA
jgi:3-oxoacyl-[acyl-carrier-protein] synthase-3